MLFRVYFVSLDFFAVGGKNVEATGDECDLTEAEQVQRIVRKMGYECWIECAE